MNDDDDIIISLLDVVISCAGQQVELASGLRFGQRRSWLLAAVAWRLARRALRLCRVKRDEHFRVVPLSRRFMAIATKHVQLAKLSIIGFDKSIVTISYASDGVVVGPSEFTLFALAPQQTSRVLIISPIYSNKMQ